MQQIPPKKRMNVYDGKTAEEVRKMKLEDIRSADKQIQERKKQEMQDKLKKKMTTPMAPVKGGQVEKAMKNAASAKNSEGRTQAQEKEYMKSMDENKKNVESFRKSFSTSGELGGAGFAARSARLAQAARKVKMTKKK